MGADILLSWVPAPPFSTNPPAEYVEALMPALHELTDEDLADICEEAFGGEVTDIFDSNNELMERIVEAVERVYGSMDYDREISYLPNGILDGDPCFIAGGMSWGDAPSSGFDAVQLVAALWFIDVWPH